MSHPHTRDCHSVPFFEKKCFFSVLIPVLTINSDSPRYGGPKGQLSTWAAPRRQVPLVPVTCVDLGLASQRACCRWQGLFGFTIDSKAPGKAPGRGNPLLSHMVGKAEWTPPPSLSSRGDRGGLGGRPTLAALGLCVSRRPQSPQPEQFGGFVFNSFTAV